ncbi:3'-5' exonuclease [uncultured Rhodoblastus sp.]|uniref:3'-5' exonuclease n=1 Tax=uncultured Rhodoblastus sp. TaxID=543037 RepID=UPI0025ED9CF2|nr:3'-5' exonuclease [uncultured Rhodoblastus sp.]
MEALAIELEQSNEYRVLRRLQPKTEFEQSRGEKAFIGVVLDTETTGLDPMAEIIELGMIKFSYSPKTGHILKIVDRFNALQQPNSPIPPEITRLTNITDDIVAGCKIDPEAVQAFVADAKLVIAHNARFDRPLAERTWPTLADKNWACALVEIPWRENNFESRKLGHLLAEHGLFHSGHRASDDCEALLHLLSLPLGATDEPAFALLLQHARQTTVRIWAQGAHFSMKDMLKLRGYAWADGANGAIKAWWIDVAEQDLNSELAFLRAEVFLNPNFIPPMATITAKERHSARIIQPIKQGFAPAALSAFPNLA